MALQTSGPISIADIQTQFGGSNPASMSEYYAGVGGSYVPSGTEGINGAIPSSGAISIGDFYGAPYSWIAASWASRTASAYSNVVINPPRAYIQIYSDGYYRVYKVEPSGSSYSQYAWHTDAPGSFSNYTVTYVNNSGTVDYTNLTQSSWSSLTTSRYAGVVNSTYTTYESASFYFYIKNPDNEQTYKLMTTIADFGS